MKQVFPSIIFGLSCFILSIVLGIIFQIAFLTVLLRASFFLLLGSIFFFIVMRFISFSDLDSVVDEEEEDLENDQDYDYDDDVDDLQIEYDASHFDRLNIGNKKKYVSLKDQREVDASNNHVVQEDEKDIITEANIESDIEDKKDIVVDLRGEQSRKDNKFSAIADIEIEENSLTHTKSDTNRSKNNDIQYNNENEEELLSDSSIEKTLDGFTEQSKSEEMNRSAERTRNSFQKDKTKFTNSLKHMINDT